MINFIKKYYKKILFYFCGIFFLEFLYAKYYNERLNFFSIISIFIICFLGDFFDSKKK